MRSRRRRWSPVAVVTWLAVAAFGFVVFTQLSGWAGTRFVAVLQSLTPYGAFALAPVAAIALWRRRLALAATSIAIGLALVPIAAPLAVPAEQEPAAPDAVGLTIASVNLLYTNDRVGAAADVLASLTPDVLVLSEYTREHQAVLQRHPLAGLYPHRIDRSGLGASGIAIWSRHPVLVAEHPDTYVQSVDVTVDGPDGTVRVVGVHPPTPIEDFDAWRRDLSIIEGIGRQADGPTAVVGDLNTTYWHPDFRSLLDVGFVDAHIARGRGLATSWPTDWAIPPFVQLDHALVVGGLVATELADIDVPGSDHRGFVVTVAPTR